MSVDLTSGMAVPLCLESRRRVFFLSPPQRVEVHTISRTCEAVKLLRLTAVRVLELAHLEVDALWPRDTPWVAPLMVTGDGSGGPPTPLP